MDPMTLATGASAVGSFMGYKGNMASARQAQQVAEYNATIAENEAILLARQSRDQQTALRRQAEQLEGSQVVAASASGVEVSGSPLLTLANTYFNTEVDAQRIISSGDAAQMNKEAEAALSRAQGQAQAAQFRTAAFGSILTGVGSYANRGIQRDMLGLQSESYRRQLQA